MTIYIIIFLFTIIFTYFAEKSNNKKYKPLFYIFSILAIILPSLLAGFRDPGIGNDSQGYAEEIWKQIIQLNDFHSFLAKYNHGYFDDIEFIYLLINWFASFFGRNIFWCFFFTNLCVILPIYCAIYNNRHKGAMWISMAIFLLLYYNVSLNLIRQSITLALSTYSLKYLENKKWTKLCVCLCLILLSHNTGLFFIFFMLIYKIYNINNKKLRTTLICLQFIALPSFFIFFQYILLFSIVLGIFPDKYINYIESEESIFDKSTFILNITLVLCFVLISYSSLKKINYTKQKIIRFTILNKLFGAILYTTSVISLWTFRISYYINYPIDIIYVPRFLLILKKQNKKKYQISLSLFFILLFSYWIWYFMIKNGNQTYPYRSHLLGI